MNDHPPGGRALRNAGRVFCVGIGVVLLLLTGCSREVSCDSPEVVDKMLALAKRGVVKDLAGQCASRLYGRIPAVAAMCPVDGNGDAASCVAACTSWAEADVTAKAGDIRTLFKDDLVAMQRCRAAVRFDVAFEGGQKVDAVITYLAASRAGGAQVALSE